MIKYSYKVLKNYYSEIKAINLIDFNKFILRKLLLNSVKFNNLLPFIIAIVVVIFSFIVQQNMYVFLPQSNITSFASFMIFTGAISLLVLILDPLLIIMLLNYLGEKIRNYFKSLFLPLKLLILFAAFYTCVTFLTHGWLSRYECFYLTILWICLYFLLINVYLAYLNDNNILKLSKFRFLFILLCSGLIAKPYLFMFLHTSQMIDYTSVNPYMYLSATNCKLISNPIRDENKPTNLAINNPNIIERQADGSCFLHWGAIRYGFAADFAVIFKKNLKPVMHKGNLSNDYVRLNCFGGNCYADDERYVKVSEDLIAEMINYTEEHRNKQ